MMSWILAIRPFRRAAFLLRSEAMQEDFTDGSFQACRPPGSRRSVKQACIMLKLHGVSRFVRHVRGFNFYGPAFEVPLLVGWRGLLRQTQVTRPLSPHVGCWGTLTSMTALRRHLIITTRVNGSNLRNDERYLQQ